MNEPNRAVGDPDPCWGAWSFLRWIMTESFPGLEAIEGDLLEGFAMALRRWGPLGAKIWLWGEVIRNVPPVARWRLRKTFEQFELSDGIARKLVWVPLFLWLLPSMIAVLLLMVTGIAICYVLDLFRRIGPPGGKGMAGGLAPLAGERTAWEEFFRHYYPRILRGFRRSLDRLMRPFYAADDFARDVWRGLLGTRDRFDFPNIAAWRGFLEQAEISPPSDPTPARIAAAIERLERGGARDIEPHRHALELARQGCSTREIAEALGWHLRKVQRVLKELQGAWIEGPYRTGGGRPAAPTGGGAPAGSAADEGGSMGTPERPTRLSPSQEARLTEYHADWSRVGTCTAPADRLRAEAAIGRLYAAIGVATPRFLWCDSPLTAQLAMSALGHLSAGLRAALSAPVVGPLRDLRATLAGALQAASRADPLLYGQIDARFAPMREELQGAMRRALIAAVQDTWRRDAWMVDHRSGLLGPPPGGLLLATLHDTLRRALRDAADDPRGVSPRGDPLWAALSEDRLWAAVQAALGAATSAAVWSPEGDRMLTLMREDRLHALICFLGQHDAPWAAARLFDRDELGARLDPHVSACLEQWAEVARSCMWWWPYRGLCVVCERPTELHLVGGRLHREDGPAVRFRDGWSVWAIDGVRVDEQVVLRPETQPIGRIRGEDDPEVKRTRIERYGWTRYLMAAGATIVDRRRNDVEATHEMLVRFPDGETLLVCTCPSTARVHGLDVPIWVRTCAQAQAWVSGGLAGRMIDSS